MVSAVITQRPDLCTAVLCSVPLTDMIRYHLFGLANIWSDEYGSSENPDQIGYLSAYSPYHNADFADYPAMLFVGAENDSRTDPMHARKMFAAIEYADHDHGTKQPVFLLQSPDTGHGGGVGIEMQLEQLSQQQAFLFEQVGLFAGD